MKLVESVGVVGVGIVGQLVVQYLKASGARRIVVIDTMQKRLEIAKAHGATHILDMNVKDAVEAVSEITGGKILDAVIDVTGSSYVLGPATRLLRKFGRAILLGDTTTP
jgi:threonine dehydrogenase-like Zn-dependent dehydrogenase